MLQKNTLKKGQDSRLGRLTHQIICSIVEELIEINIYLKLL